MKMPAEPRLNVLESHQACAQDNDHSQMKYGDEVGFREKIETVRRDFENLQ